MPGIACGRCFRKHLGSDSYGPSATFPLEPFLPAQPFLFERDATIVLDSKVDGKLRRNPGERARDCQFDDASCILRIVGNVINHRVQRARDAHWERVNDLRDAVAEERAMIHQIEAVFGVNLAHNLPQLPRDWAAVSVIPILVRPTSLPRNAEHRREILRKWVEMDVDED